MGMESDWDLGEGLDPEGPSGAELDRFGDALMKCRRCRGVMYDQATVCPECGECVIEGAKEVSVVVCLGVVVCVSTRNKAHVVFCVFFFQAEDGIRDTNS